MAPNLLPPERRLFSRVACRQPASLQRGGDAWSCTLVDLSLNGALLDIPEDFATRAGERYRFHIPFFVGAPEGAEVFADVIVVHARERSVGLRFEDVDPESMPHLRELILLFAGDPTTDL